MRLLDTDTCIELLRGNERVIEHRTRIRDEVVTSWITAAELYYGAAKSKATAHNHALVTRFLATLEVLDLDSAAAQHFGEQKHGSKPMGGASPMPICSSPRSRAAAGPCS